jgi:hypothetical protein
MRTWARWTARTALFTASFAAVGVTTMGLASAGVTTGDHSIGGGNQVTAPISVPVSACGNSIALLGGALAGCQGGAYVKGGTGSGSGWTSGDSSILGGNQVTAPVRVPVSACGNSVALLGHALSGCAGGATVSGGHGRHHSHCHHSHHGTTEKTSGSHSIGGGNQVNAPVGAPVSICGNAVGHALAGCRGGASVTGDYSYTSMKTSGDHSIGGGNQANAPVHAPASLCGNAAAVLGGALSGCEGGAAVGGHGMSSHGSMGMKVLHSLKLTSFSARQLFQRAGTEHGAAEHSATKHSATKSASKSASKKGATKKGATKKGATKKAATKKAATKKAATKHSTKQHHARNLGGTVSSPLSGALAGLPTSLPLLPPATSTPLASSSLSHLL